MKYGPKSYKPWLLSLVLEISSVYKTYQKMQQNKLSENEENECKRRIMSLFYYLVRSPFFELLREYCLPRTKRKIFLIFSTRKKKKIVPQLEQPFCRFKICRLSENLYRVFLNIWLFTDNTTSTYQQLETRKKTNSYSACKVCVCD